MPETVNRWGPYVFRHFYIPERMMDGLQRYVVNHIAPGDFLMAVLTNDLHEALGRADDENMANLPAYGAFLYNNVPSNCWGSPEKVQAWLAERKV